MKDGQKSQNNFLRVILQAVIMMALAAFIYFFWNHEVFGIIIGGSGLLILILGLMIRPIARGMVWLQKKVMLFIGTIMTWVLLVPFFYLCFLPGRIVQLITGKDPLKRKLRKNKSSYWEPYTGSFNIEQWRRQF